MKNYITQSMIQLEENLVIGTMNAHHIKQIVFDMEDPLWYGAGIRAAVIENNRLMFVDNIGDQISVNPILTKYYFWCRDAYNKLLTYLREI